MGEVPENDLACFLDGVCDCCSAASELISVGFILMLMLLSEIPTFLEAGVFLATGVSTCC